MKIQPVGAELYHSDGRTDGQKDRQILQRYSEALLESGPQSVKTASEGRVCKLQRAVPEVTLYRLTTGPYESRPLFRLIDALRTVSRDSVLRYNRRAHKGERQHHIARRFTDFAPLVLLIEGV
jgi:hypothetical protein